MAQLFFKYGAMNSGKTIEILKVAHNYEEQDKPVVIMTSGLDTRSGVGNVSSRIGLERDAIPIFDETDLFHLIKDLGYKPYCILIDEAQFLKKHHVLAFTKIVDELGIPVMAFGLKNDFRNELFEGSKYLLLYADKIEEMKASIGAMLSLAPDRLGITATTGEKLTSFGRGEGIGVFCIITVEREEWM